MQVLSPKSVSTLTETPSIDGRGLGWLVGGSSGERYIDHAGGGAGFATIMRLYPESGIGVAILANSTDLDRGGLVELIVEIVGAAASSYLILATRHGFYMRLHLG